MGTYKGRREIISTEDMVARTEIMDERMEGWTNASYWTDMIPGEYTGCSECPGDDSYIWRDDCPKLCGCDEDGRMIITMGFMKKLRRIQWELQNNWDEADLDRKFTGSEVLHEDLQDQSTPMVLIGTDVINLYPSLDIAKVVEEVSKAVMVSSIKWEEIDYLEGARYMALNWSEEKCRLGGLRRILTYRIKTGSRLCLKGAGAQGYARGDQEQWVFPHVRLRQ